MTIREQIEKALDDLSPEALEGVLEYINFIKESTEVDPTEAELQALRRGREEFARGEFADWEDIKGQ